MSKELETLKDLYARASVHCPIDEIHTIINELEIVEKALKVLEIIRTRGINLIVPSNVFSNEHIDIQVFTRSLSKEELELVKEVIGLWMK